MKSSAPPPACRDVYVARYDSQKVSRVAVRRVNVCDGRFTHPALSTDGRKLAYWGCSRGRMDVWVCDLATEAAAPVTEGEGVFCHPAWSPDAKRLVYAHNPACDPLRVASSGLYDPRVYAPRELWTLDLKTGARTRITRNGLDNERPAWSPDGTRLAYVQTRGEHQVVVVRNLASGAETTASPPEGCWYRPAWHPDGVRLACNNKGAGPHYLWLLDGAGSRPRRISPPAPEATAVHDHGACWSADGNSLLFHSDRSGAWGLWQVRADGADLRPLPVDGFEGVSHPGCDAGEQVLCFDAARGAGKDQEPSGKV